MSSSRDAQLSRVGRRPIYRGKEPQRTPLFWLAAGLVGTCLVGLFLRGPDPFILAALFLSPACVFLYYLFLIWGQMRIRRIDLDHGDLIVQAGFQKERRIKLAQIGPWRLEDIPLYSLGLSYDANQSIQIETGAAVTGPALTARDRVTNTRIDLVLERAQIDLEAFRTFAPDAVAELEKRAARKGKSRINFGPISVGRADARAPNIISKAHEP